MVAVRADSYNFSNTAITLQATWGGGGGLSSCPTKKYPNTKALTAAYYVWILASWQDCESEAGCRSKPRHWLRPANATEVAYFHRLKEITGRSKVVKNRCAAASCISAA